MIAGPFVGRLLLRLVLAGLILGALWCLGASWKWTRAQQLLIGTLVLTMPMFLRAFFTDYVEYLVVALGICLVCLCLREQHTRVTASVIGLLSGLIVIANPISITLVGLCFLAAMVLGASTVRGRLVLCRDSRGQRDASSSSPASSCSGGATAWTTSTSRRSITSASTERR